MCSLDGDCVVERVEKKIIDTNENCRKCQSKSSIKLRGSDNYCNDCFEAYATHKFRGTLGKSKLVRPNDKILVGFSGSAGSVALLNLIRAGMQESVHKRLVFETQVIFIDDFLEPRTEIEKKSSIDSVISLIKSFGFPGYFISLSEIFSADLKINKIDEVTYDHHQGPEDSLRNLFQALTNKTAKQELLKKLRLTLLASVARNLQCSKVFLADSATSLAVDILSNVAVGRGAQLSLDVGFVDDRFEGLAILRPMRDFSKQELDYYLELHCLEPLRNGKFVSFVMLLLTPSLKMEPLLFWRRNFLGLFRPEGLRLLTGTMESASRNLVGSVKETVIFTISCSDNCQPSQLVGQ